MTTSLTSRPAVAELCDALDRAGGQIAAMLRRIDDPTPVAVGTWTIGDTARHLAGSGEYFLGAARGEITPERHADIDATNARALADDPERDPGRLADRFARGHTALVEYARAVDGDPPVHPFEGVEVPLSCLLGIELGEVLVHGFDIARVAVRPWRIEARHAVLTHQAYLPLLPYLLDTQRAAGTALRLELRIRGMAAVVIVVEEARLHLEAPSRTPVDAHLSVDPVTYLLLVWNRIGRLRPMLTGRLVAWGRRPWRVGELQALVKI